MTGLWALGIVLANAGFVICTASIGQRLSVRGRVAGGFAMGDESLFLGASSIDMNYYDWREWSISESEGNSNNDAPECDNLYHLLLLGAWGNHQYISYG